jgi:hypothetical protein
MATKTDITSMTEAEIKEYLTQRKVQSLALQREKGVEARKDVEAYCLKKHGMSLAMIFTATRKAPQLQSYRNPKDGTTYIYSGRGKLPAWCKDEYLAN